VNSSLNPSLSLSPRRRLPETGEWVEQIVIGDRQALATAITLAESQLPEHRRRVEDLLRRLGAERDDTTRIGITGLPGAGKSTFIEALGVRLLEKRH
jgi:LAO/AO transport system kinase